jgi:uncharacterized protein YndB with AHSA1/START domain
MEAVSSIYINAPIEKVFEYIDDDEKLKLWIDGLISTEYPDGLNRDNAVGTKFKQKLKEGGKIVEYDGEVLAYTKPSFIKIKIWNPTFGVTVDYNLSPESEGTKLDYKAVIISDKWYFKLFAPIIQLFNRGAVDKQLLRFKTVVESGIN